MAGGQQNIVHFMQRAQEISAGGTRFSLGFCEKSAHLGISHAFKVAVSVSFQPQALVSKLPVGAR